MFHIDRFQRRLFGWKVRFDHCIIVVGVVRFGEKVAVTFVNVLSCTDPSSAFEFLGQVQICEGVVVGGLWQS